MSIATHTLPNGFRIVTEHMPGLQSASVGVWVSAGSRHEGEGETGIAHFLEHMAFKGTARRSALQIAEEIEDVGGYLNAYTSKEMTAYYARVLSADVPLAIDLIGDIVMNPAFDAREISVERGVILQEIGQTLDTPDDIIFDWLHEVSYPDQPFGRSILGPADLVRGFGEGDLRRFTGQFYAPDQMILSAAGGVDHEKIVRLAEEIFGRMPGRTVPLALGARFSGGERREVKTLEQAHFALSLEGPGYRDADVYTAQVFATALGGGMSSRLFQEIREKRGLCYTIGSHASAYADTGSLTIYAGTGAGEVADLARITVDELRRAAEDMSEAEITRARAQMKAGLLMGLESPSARCERLARVLAIWGRVPDLSEAVERIDAVDAVGARAYARALLARPPALALYGPVSAAPDHVALAQRLAA
ncbi:insulinase family protein (plasmid) [Paroceanicella profunda]|uniref:Insulinase family protein n=1 Tax=Paroceanicella profunda TaxID=2579971 RepID=A0A5B8G5D7_9RHOB|nr:pitrilysin family protein [Paroceanicella profunda]QDL94173.1 insulinase family protein [Paroceanicella profunda]